jgi:hypothetical protein
MSDLRGALRLLAGVVLAKPEGPMTARVVAAVGGQVVAGDLIEHRSSGVMWATHTSDGPLVAIREADIIGVWEPPAEG